MKSRNLLDGTPSRARTVRPASRFALLLATMLAVSSCNVFTSACTLIGCLNGLTVHLTTMPPGSWRVALLVNGVVQAEELCPGTGQCAQNVHFTTSATDGVSIRVTTGSGTRTTDYAKVTYTASRPNGKGCEPVCQNASVTAEVPV